MLRTVNEYWTVRTQMWLAYDTSQEGSEIKLVTNATPRRAFLEGKVLGFSGSDFSHHLWPVHEQVFSHCRSWESHTFRRRQVGNTLMNDSSWTTRWEQSQTSVLDNPYNSVTGRQSSGSSDSFYFHAIYEWLLSKMSIFMDLLIIGLGVGCRLRIYAMNDGQIKLT